MGHVSTPRRPPCTLPHHSASLISLVSSPSFVARHGERCTGGACLSRSATTFSRICWWTFSPACRPTIAPAARWRPSPPSVAAITPCARQSGFGGSARIATSRPSMTASAPKKARAHRSPWARRCRCRTALPRGGGSPPMPRPRSSGASTSSELQPASISRTTVFARRYRPGRCATRFAVLPAQEPRSTAGLAKFVCACSPPALAQRPETHRPVAA